MKIRPIEPADYPRILEIYNPYILTTCVTFEIKPLTIEEFSARIDRIREHFPFIVAEDEDGKIMGYAYLSPFHERAAYRFSADLSLYCDMDARHKGYGSALYREIEQIAKASGFKNIISLITDVNAASVDFHKKMGFETAGHLEHIAYKHGRWIGTIHMIKQLDKSDDEPAFTGEYGIGV